MSRSGRVLVCTRCRQNVRVYEAVLGARAEAEHRFLDPATYTCGSCLERAGAVARLALEAVA